MNSFLTRGSVRSPDEAGAGALFDLGAHRADLLIFLMNSKPKRVIGIVKRLVTPRGIYDFRRFILDHDRV